MTTAAQRRYWQDLVRVGCLICGSPAEVAHAHGGSIVERMQEPKARGKKLQRMDWLVLPLCPQHGREPYPLALDTNVARWEKVNGTQASFIDALCLRFRMDLWTLAKRGKK